MRRRITTFAEAARFAETLPIYDRRGRRMLTRAEWEQLPRWRRLRDLLFAWDPPKSFRPSRRSSD